MSHLLDLFRRLDVLRGWPSVVRVAVWVVVWTFAISAIVVRIIPAPQRDVVADVPPSDVGYVAPVSRSDLHGFLPAAADDDTFTVAWIGGSEVKLDEVSLAAAVDRRIEAVGGTPVRTEVYSLIAPRIIDMIRAVDAAADAEVDAVVMALNPAWTRSGLSVRGWENLDVSYPGSLWTDPATLVWAAALASPDDLAWWSTRALVGAVEGQNQLNDKVTERLEPLDLVLDPADPVPPEIDPRLPDADSFWLVQEHGTEIVGDEPARVEALMRGSGLPDDPARALVDVLVGRLAAMEVPVYAYASPLNPDLLADPGFNEAAQIVEAFWGDVADDLDDPMVAIDHRMWSRDDRRAAGTFNDAIHFADPEPFADFLARRLCVHWVSVDPSLECT